MSNEDEHPDAKKSPETNGATIRASAGTTVDG